MSPSPASTQMRASPNTSPSRQTLTRNSSSTNLMSLANTNNERESRRDVSPPNLESSTFRPFSSPVQTMPDVSKLSLSDTASSSSSGSDNIDMGAGAYGAVGEDTLRRSTSTSYSTPPSTALNRSYSSGVSSFIPRTSWSADTPLTPFTPMSAKGSGYESETKQVRGKVQVGMSLALGSARVEAQSAEELGRYLAICQVPRDVRPQELQNVIGNFAEYRSLVIKHLSTKGCIFVTFWDPREALKLYRSLHSRPVIFREGDQPEALQCMQVDKGVIEKETETELEYCKVWHNSEAVIVLEVTGGVELRTNKLKETLDHFGDVMWLQELGGGRKFLIEFWDTRHAAEALQYLDNRPVGDGKLIVTYQSQDPFSIAPRGDKARSESESVGKFSLGSVAYTPGSLWSSRSLRPLVQGYSNSWGTRDNDAYYPGRDYSATTPSTRQGTPITPATSLGYSYNDQATGDYQTFTTSNKHRSLPPTIKVSSDSNAGDSYLFGTPSNLVAMNKRMSEPRQLENKVDRLDIFARARVGQGIGGHCDPKDRQRIPEENRVFKERILSGHDRRTTIMIKDVPNKLTRQELVDILNEVVPGGFDFVYLRFDFNNRCNVGYAFVNFSDVKSLYEFIVAKVGKKWNLFASEKILQVSYANIQGKAALINKFRNSAVMCVTEEWRPQIFYSSGAWRGKPEPFPTSANPAQMHKPTALRLSSLSEFQYQSKSNSHFDIGDSPGYPNEGQEYYNYDYAPSMLDRSF